MKIFGKVDNMDTHIYKKIWQKKDPLYVLNHRLHDGVKPAELAERAEDRVNRFFVRHFPYAAPQAGARVMELGSGVGWIMQALVSAYPQLASITGLDISENCINMARKRWSEPKANFVLYEGENIPFANDSFDNIYSVSCLQHIEKHVACLIMAELFRVLRPGGYATLHFLDIRHILKARHSHLDYCRDYVKGRENMHRLYYYTQDELALLLAKVIGVKDLQIVLEDTSLLVSFTK